MTTEAMSLRNTIVGAVLRRYREQAGYKLHDAARILDCDKSKISRIEIGIRGIRVQELRVLLAEYGVDAAGQDGLSAIADRRAARGWWDEYADVLPARARDYLAIEEVSSRLLVYEPQQVPALLQTRAYAREVASADPGLADGTWQRAVEAVMIRQETVLDHGRLQVTAVVGEAALRQQAGGTHVMGAQLSQLAAYAGDLLPVSIRVLPFSAGAHAGSGSGPLAILELGDAPGVGVVHLGGPAGGMYLADPAAVTAHSRFFRHVRAAAMQPDSSAQLIHDIASESQRNTDPV